MVRRQVFSSVENLGVGVVLSGVLDSSNASEGSSNSRLVLVNGPGGVGSNGGGEWSLSLLKGVSVDYGSVVVVFSISVSADLPLSGSSSKSISVRRIKDNRPSVLDGGDWQWLWRSRWSVVFGLSLVTPFRVSTHLNAVFVI
ncbi:hypothetical protein Bca101_012874 [Brassica carinata]